MKIKQGSLGSALLLIVPICLATTPTSQQSTDSHNAYKVGKCYGGGVIYYVNPDAKAPAGKKGLIVSLTDAGAPTLYEWDTGVVTLPDDLSTSLLYFTGASNTRNILDGTIIIPSSNAQAATAANAYTSAKSCRTCTPWYLPSRDELATLYFQSTNIVNFGKNCAGYSAPSYDNAYWSSTERALDVAWFVDFASGDVNAEVLTNQYRVRAVRAF